MTRSRLHTLFLGSFDRSVATVSLLSGLISLVISLVTYRLPSPPPEFIVIRDYAVVLTLVLCISLLSIKYYRKYEMAEAFRDRLAGQLSESHQMIHKFRDHYFTELREPILDGVVTKDEATHISRAYFKKVCHSVLTDVRKQLLDYFRSRGFRVGEDLTVTIKVLITCDEAQSILNELHGTKADRLSPLEKYVVTGFRDPYTWEHFARRKEVRKAIYRANDENTAIKAVLIDHKQQWFSNDLRIQQERGEYRNSNPQWRQLYNASHLLPIRCKPGDSPAHYHPYGILAADSINGSNHNLFDDITTFNILAAAADTLALMFAHLEIVELLKRGGPAQLLLKGVTHHE